MLSGQVLNSDATLNNFIVLETKNFIPGSQFTFVMRILNDDLGIRYIPADTAIVTLVFQNQDGTELSKVATPLTDDRSILSIEISELESTSIRGGNMSFSVDVAGDGSNIMKGIMSNALARVLEGAC